jgi:3-oxoadipate enol-lactonase
MATVEIDGFQLYYEVHGQGDPLVFAHGVGGNHAHWFNQVALFADRYQVIVFDHRGFGNSRDPGGPGRSRFVEDLRALLDHLGLDRVTLVAQSMGGGTCVGFTAAYPERVKALVLADTVIGFKLPEGLAAEVAVQRKAGESLSQLERVLSKRTREENKPVALAYLQMSSFNLVNRHTAGGSFGDGMTPEALVATGIPVLFLVGSEDVLAPPPIVRQLQALVPGSTYVEIDGPGHSVYFEAPDAFNDAVQTWLDAAGVR